MPIRTAKPYAAKAIIEHQFDVNHADIYVTFRFTMDQTVKPSHDLWKVLIDSVEENVTASSWQDAWTLLLTVAGIANRPAQVTVEYEGPDETLRITWFKQWEPWGPIVSEEIPPVSDTLTYSTGPAPQDAVDIANVKVLFLDQSGNTITIGGFIGGINGQVLHIVRLDAGANAVTIEHNHGTGNQDILLHAGADEVLVNEFGGWCFCCDGSNWYDMSHAKHV